MQLNEIHPRRIDGRESSPQIVKPVPSPFFPALGHGQSVFEDCRRLDASKLAPKRSAVFVPRKRQRVETCRQRLQTFNRERKKLNQRVTPPLIRVHASQDRCSLELDLLAFQLQRLPDTSLRHVEHDQESAPPFASRDDQNSAQDRCQVLERDTGLSTFVKA